MAKQVAGVHQNFYDTEENFYLENPLTLPGVLYISYTPDGITYIRVGNGAHWRDIDPVASTYSGVPIGTLIYCLSDTPPKHYLPLNGQEISRETYLDLYNFISGTSMIISEELWQSDPKYRGFFSSGDGELTFRLPLIDDIILEAATPGKERKLGSYKQGTLIGTDYVHGKGTTTPYMTYLNFAVALRNGLTTPDNLVMPDEDDTSLSNTEYAEKVKDWLDNDDGGHRDSLIHPEKQDIIEALNLDTPQEDTKVTSSKSSSIIGSDSLEYVSVVGMTRPETIAYSVFIKYTKF